MVERCSLGYGLRPIKVISRDCAVSAVSAVWEEVTDFRGPYGAFEANGVAVIN